MDEQIKTKNEYNGNGWSSYQKMVLAQLEGHTKLLEQLMKEISEVKHHITVTDINSKNWRDNTDKQIERIQEEVGYILDDDNGIDARLRKIEEDKRFQERSSLKFRASWGFIGGAIVVTLDLLLKAFLALFPHHP